MNRPTVWASHRHSLLLAVCHLMDEGTKRRWVAVDGGHPKNRLPDSSGAHRRVSEETPEENLAPAVVAAACSAAGDSRRRPKWVGDLGGGTSNVGVVQGYLDMSGENMNCGEGGPAAGESGMHDREKRTAVVTSASGGGGE